MGAGNPLIRSFDEEMYSPRTLFIDFTEGLDKEECVKEHFEANEREDFDDLSEDELNTEFYRLVEWNSESFIDDYWFNLEEIDIELRAPEESEKWHDVLSAEFRGSGLVIAQTDDLLIVHCGGELHHFSIGFIPNFIWDNISEELWDEHSDKEEWYIARDLDFDERIRVLTNKEYEKRLNAWKKKYEPLCRLFFSHYKNSLSERNGAWMSFSIKNIGETYKFL